VPVPPELVHDKEYVYDPAVFIVPMLCVPELALEPDQLPPAVQELGVFVADQVMVELLPELIELGLTDIDTTGIAITVSDTDFESDPAVLLQLSV
jgi:hypothetical protein